jgi:hypothetical protein
MPTTPRKPTTANTPKFTDTKDENAPTVDSDNAASSEVRGGQDLHTRLEALESRVSDLEDTRDGEYVDPAVKSREINQDDYERDDNGNVVHDGDMALTVDNSGKVLRDPNKR